MGRWRSESILLEQRANLRGRPAVVSGEFDLLVPDLRDLAKRAWKIRFHQIANSVQLETDFFQLSPGCQENSIGQGISARDAEGGDAQRREECAAGV